MNKQGFWTCTAPGAKERWDVGPAGRAAWAGAEPSDGGGGVRPRGGLVRTTSQAGKSKGTEFLPRPLFIILNSVSVCRAGRQQGCPGLQSGWSQQPPVGRVGPGWICTGGFSGTSLEGLLLSTHA